MSFGQWATPWSTRTTPSNTGGGQTTAGRYGSNAYRDYYQRLIEANAEEAAYSSSMPSTSINTRPGATGGRGVVSMPPTPVNTTGNDRPTTTAPNTTQTVNTTGSDRPTTPAPNTPAEGQGGVDNEGTPFTMYGRTYSPADLEKMFRDPSLFATAWLDAQGMATPTMLANIDDIYKVLPDLAMLANGTQIAVGPDGLPIAAEPATTAALYQDILEEYTTPGGSLMSPSQGWADILGTGSMDINNPTDVNWIQLATQWDATTDGPYSVAAQVANTNRLLLAAAAGAAPRMRGLIAGLASWLGVAYQNAVMDSNMPGEEKPWYGEWIRQNSMENFA